MVLDRRIKLGKYYLLISGILLVVTAIANPGGIAGQTRANMAAARHRLGWQSWNARVAAVPAGNSQGA